MEGLENLPIQNLLSGPQPRERINLSEICFHRTKNALKTASLSRMHATIGRFDELTVVLFYSSNENFSQLAYT